MYEPTRTALPIFLLIVGLGGCGGGGGGGGNNGGNNGGTGWTAGVYVPSASFAAKCVSPRSGIDPGTGMPYPDIQGVRLDENNWLRSWSNELYLWYDEIVDRDPANHTTLAYFDLLKTTATTATGSPKDKFHFTLSTAEFQALAQSGVSIGYGAEWAISSSYPPRLVRIAYTQPNSPATEPSANLTRGTRVWEVDGVDLVNADDARSVKVLNAGLFPAKVGESHTFRIQDPGSPVSVTRYVTLQSAAVEMKPVQAVRTIATATGTVGYMLFNEHVATAEKALIDAIGQLRAGGVTDLILDLRYNGGGYLHIASELAYMIVGSVPTAGRTFEEIHFNDKHPTTDPVSGDPLAPIPFHDRALGFSAPVGQPLPTLDLARVFVLTGPNTCSASESIINSLRGIDVEVLQVGLTTCGKPYGFYPADNCGTTYFTIQFQGVNSAGFGDYGDGFSPGNDGGNLGVMVPGCGVEDDFSHALGDTAELRLAAALAYREHQSCSTPFGTASSGFGYAKTGVPLAAVDGLVHKSPWLENRILGR